MLCACRTYTTLYKGDVLQAPPVSGVDSSVGVASVESLPAAASSRVTASSIPIDVSLLQRPDPILWYDSIPLFDDELHDNGIASLSVRVRVMESCFLVLLQFWLRVDGQIMRVYNTRLFHKFGEGYLLREQTRHEDTFDALAKRGMPRTSTLYQDPNIVARKLTLQTTECDQILLTDGTASAAAP